MNLDLLAVHMMSKLAQATARTGSQRVDAWKNRLKSDTPGNYDAGSESITASPEVMAEARDQAAERQLIANARKAKAAELAAAEAKRIQQYNAATPNIPNAPLSHGSYGSPQNPALYTPFSPKWNELMQGRSLDLGGESMKAPHPLSTRNAWENYKANAQDLGVGQEDVDAAERLGVAPITDYGQLLRQGWNNRAQVPDFNLSLPQFGGKSPFSM